jgi:hypothetical protein
MRTCLGLGGSMEGSRRDFTDEEVLRAQFLERMCTFTRTAKPPKKGCYLVEIDIRPHE